MTGLIELKELDLDDNDISDITPLAGLTKLEEVDLDGNGISDAFPLVGLTSLTYVNLEDNPLNQISIETHIPAIEANGARVDFDLPPLPADINKDGVVNIQDLVLVASRIGHDCPNEADINGDAVINVQDLILVAQSFGLQAKNKF